MQSVLQLVGFPHNDLRSGGNFVTLLSVHKIGTRVAQCIDKEILIRKIYNIDIGIDIDKENFEKLIIY